MNHLRSFRHRASDQFTGQHRCGYVAPKLTASVRFPSPGQHEGPARRYILRPGLRALQVIGAVPAIGRVLGAVATNSIWPPKSTIMTKP